MNAPDTDPQRPSPLPPGQIGRRVDGYLPIAQYGVIGDCHSIALVGTDGSIDWCCLPRFDHASVFGRLIDAERGGAWELQPVDDFTARQQYGDKSNVLRTRFQTSTGFAEVLDFMPVRDADMKHHARPHEHPRIVRLISGLSGSVTFRQRLDPRPDYGRAILRLTGDGHRLHADRGGLHYCFTGSVPLTGAIQEFTVGPGETVLMSMCVNDGPACGRDMTRVEQGLDVFRSTRDYWWQWLNQCTYQGPYQWHVWRSALLLKMLTYVPTGAIIAAPTTSLPEWIGGRRNWDYRFTWLRDASFTLYSMFQLGFGQEAADFMDWLTTIATDRAVKNLYDLDGHPPSPEEELGHLSGYRDSRPVRINNGAVDQLQLDVYGELMDSVYLFTLNGGRVSGTLWNALVPVINRAVERWHEPDAGLWEVRGPNRHFTYSKAMCWAAVDRGIKIAGSHGFAVDERWEPAREAIYRDVMEHGFSAEQGSFTQVLGGEQLDASALRLVQLGFLPLDDPRLRTTIDAIDRELSEGPLVFRYRREHLDDGVEDPEGTFVICAFWLADALALAGDLEAAERRFEHLLAYASPLGLLSEEVHPGTGEMLGNFPQAFSHLSLISAAVNIERRRNRTIEGGAR